MQKNKTASIPLTELWICNVKLSVYVFTCVYLYTLFKSVRTKDKSKGHFGILYIIVSEPSAFL